MRSPRPWPLPQRPTAFAELVARGATRAMVATQVGAGRLIRLREGVYLAASAWPEDPGRRHLLLARAEQVANPGAAISHASAALAWDLPSPPLAPWPDGPPTLTLPRDGGHRCRRSATGVLVAAYLPGRHVTLDPEGWPLTTPARTAVDLARTMDLPDALVVLDAAARLLCAELVASPRRGDYGNPVLRGVARDALREACSGRNGFSGLRAVIELVDPRRESPIESLTAGHLHRAGVPMPEFQVPISTPLGTLYPDCYWKRQRLIGEADGAVKYGDAQAMVWEKEREQALRDLGYGIVRWLGKEITHRPQVVVDRIRRALDLAT